MTGTSTSTIQARRLERLRDLRTRRPADFSLAFLHTQFQRTITQPYRQFQNVCAAWEQQVPPDLVPHTRLEGISRGILRVAVNSSAHLYTLDRVLRGGLERRILAECKGPSPPRRIRLHVVRFEE